MRMPLATRYADFDTKGHANNAVYLTWFEEARHRAWVERLGGNADFPFIIAESSVKYLSEAMIGDEMEIEITTSEIRTKAWVWTYAIREVGTGRVVAEGKTVQVMYDYAARKTVPIPTELRAPLEAV
jgi:acyl-CoA thioester hydrolase